MRHLATVIVVMALATALTTGAARAEPRGFAIGSRPVWFVTGGITTGGTVARAERGPLVGGELSLARVRDRHVLGAYVDAYRDFGVDGTMITAGPELALVRRSLTLPLAVGVDGGGAARLGDDAGLGATGRVFVTVAGALSVYGRYVFIDGAADRHAVQVGVTLKFPLLAPFGADLR